MGAALVVAGKDLRQRLRDRTAYIVGVLAPLVLAALIGLAFGRSSGTSFSATFAVADGDRGPVATAFVRDVLGGPDLRGVVSLREVGTRAEAVRLAEDGSVAAAVIVPPGFSQVATGGPVVPLEVVRNARSPIGADVAVALAGGFTARLDSVRLAVATATAAGARADHAALAAAAQRAAAGPAPIELTETPVSGASSAGGSFAPAMGIFFMFFVVGLQARSLVLERQQGTLTRLLAAPVPRWSVLAGKALAGLVLGVASLGTMAVASRLLLRADWGDPLSAAVLILVTAFAVTSVIAFVLTLARTEQQAALYTSLVTFAFALLGGNFVDLSQAPELLRRVSLLTPNGWALRAFSDLAAESGGLSSVLPAVAAITGFGLVAALSAALRARRLVSL